MNITLARGAYMQLVDLVNTSAANFELLRHRDQTMDQTSSQPQKRIDGSDGPLRE